MVGASTGRCMSVDPDVFGSIAATLTTLCFVPQALKVVREKDTSGISLIMYMMFTVGVVFWLIYGIMLDRWPMIIANIITLVLALTILAMKLRHG